MKGHFFHFCHGFITCERLWLFYVYVYMPHITSGVNPVPIKYSKDYFKCLVSAILTMVIPILIPFLPYGN